MVIPDDRRLTEIPGEPGWFKISGGHVQELYEQQRLLLFVLEQTELELKECKGGR